MARRRTPQEKKGLSYEKDQRDAYGENDKGSRKSVRKRKRIVNRANRRKAGEQLAQADVLGDPDAAEGAEIRLLSEKPKRWSKEAGISLGEHVERQAVRRARLGMESDSSSEEAR